MCGGILEYNSMYSASISSICWLSACTRRPCSQAGVSQQRVLPALKREKTMPEKNSGK